MNSSKVKSLYAIQLSTNFLEQFRFFYNSLQTNLNNIENKSDQMNKNKSNQINENKVTLMDVGASTRLINNKNNLKENNAVKKNNNNINVYEISIIYNPDDKILIIKKNFSIIYQMEKEFKVSKSKEGNYKISGFIPLDDLISIDSENILNFLKKQKQNENICESIFDVVINLLNQLHNNYIQEQQEEEEEEDDDDYGYHYNYNYGNDENYAYSDKEMDSYVPQEYATETQITEINVKLNINQKEINLIDINNYKLIKTINLNNNNILLIIQFDEKQSELVINALKLRSKDI
jgi:hypothetical protein